MERSTYRPGNAAPSAADPSSAAADSHPEHTAAGIAAVDREIERTAADIVGIAVADSAVGTATANIGYTAPSARSFAGHRAGGRSWRRSVRPQRSACHSLYKKLARHWRRAYHGRNWYKTLYSWRPPYCRPGRDGPPVLAEEQQRSAPVTTRHNAYKMPRRALPPHDIAGRSRGQKRLALRLAPRFHNEDKTSCR